MCTRHGCYTVYNCYTVKYIYTAWFTMHTNVTKVNPVLPKLWLSESSRLHESGAALEPKPSTVTLYKIHPQGQGEPSVSHDWPTCLQALSLADRLQHHSQQRMAPMCPMRLSPLLQTLATRDLLKDSSPCLWAGAPEQGKPPLQSSRRSEVS